MRSPKIQRRNFNGGMITPELWYRSDLELFTKSCKELKNMVVTPWGGVTRRSPTKLILNFNNEVYGEPIRYIPFRFSNNEFYHIVVTNNAGSAKAYNPNFIGTRWENDQSWSSNAAFMVVKPDGSLATLWDKNFDSNNGEWREADFNKHLIATNLSPQEAEGLEYSNINDVVYLTFRGAKPLSEFFRFAYQDGDSYVDYWTFAPNISEVGPFLDENPDSDSFIELYDRDMVQQGNCPGVAKGTLDINDYVELNPGNAQGKPNMATHKGQFAYALHWPDGAPQRGNLVDSQIRLRASIEDLQTDWANTSALENNFFRGVFNESGSNSYDPEFDSPSAAKQTCVSPMAPMSGVVRVTTRGAWDGTLVLEESKDGITWDELASITSDQGDNNEIFEREISDWAMGVRVRMARANELSGDWESPGCHWTLEPDYIYLYFRVVHQINDKTVVAMSLNEGYGWPGDESKKHYWYGTSTSVQNSRKGSFSYLHQGFSAGDSNFSQFRYASDLGSLKAFQTHRWSVGAWGPETGFPMTHAIHQERMCLGGNRVKPNTIWASRVNDWSNFADGKTDVSAFSFTAQSDSSDGIKWMKSTNNFLVGTGEEEILVSGGTNNMAFSATNIRVRPQTFYGSAPVRPVTAADTVFFVERNARRLRSIGYDFETDQYLASDIMILISSLTRDGEEREIKRIAFVRNPFTALFVLLDDGTALYFVYEAEQNVKGWSAIQVGGGKSSLDSVRRGVGLEESDDHADIIDCGVNQGEQGDAVYLLVHRQGVEAGATNASEHTLEMYEQHKPGSKPELPYLDAYSEPKVGEWTSLYVEDPLVVNRFRTMKKWKEYRISEASGARGFKIFQYDPSIYSDIGKKNYIEGSTKVGYRYESVLEPTDLVAPFDFGPMRQTPEITLYLHDSAMPNIQLNGYPSKTKYAWEVDLLEEDAADYNNWSKNIDWDTMTQHGSISLALKNDAFILSPLSGGIKLSTMGTTKPYLSLRLATRNTLPFNISAIGIKHPLIES